MGETRRDHYAIQDGSEIARRMRASPHWTEGREFLGSLIFQVTEEGRAALYDYILENAEVPARYAVTYRDFEGTSIIPAKSRSAARYAAYVRSDVDWPFLEFLAGIKSVRIHSKASTPKSSPV